MSTTSINPRMKISTPPGFAIARVYCNLVANWGVEFARDFTFELKRHLSVFDDFSIPDDTEWVTRWLPYFLAAARTHAIFVYSVSPSAATLREAIAAIVRERYFREKGVLLPEERIFEEGGFPADPIVTLWEAVRDTDTFRYLPSYFPSWYFSSRFPFPLIFEQRGHQLFVFPSGEAIFYLAPLFDVQEYGIFYLPGRFSYTIEDLFHARVSVDFFYGNTKKNMIVDLEYVHDFSAYIPDEIPWGDIRLSPVSEEMSRLFVRPLSYEVSSSGRPSQIEELWLALEDLGFWGFGSGFLQKQVGGNDVKR